MTSSRGESVSLARLAAAGGAMVVLRPGAGDQLIRLAPLVRPLVELHWVRMVADLNSLALTEDDLRETSLRRRTSRVSGTASAGPPRSPSGSLLLLPWSTRQRFGRRPLRAVVQVA